MNTTPVNIVLASNENYLPGLIVSLFSMLYNSDKSRSLNVYVLDGDIKDESWEQINSKTKYIFKKVTLVRVPKDGSKLGGFKKDYGNSIMAYVRLLIPDLIPENKVVYVDSDIYWGKDICELFDIDLKGNSIAAVISPWTNKLKMDCEPFIKEYSLDPEAPYFNSGVLLIDIEN